MENVTIQNNAFVFCRYSVAIMIWLALAFRSVYLLGAVFVILALSALLKVHRAPMVWLYSTTLGRRFPGRDVVLDVRAMRFAHILGAGLAAISIVLVLRGFPIAWWFVLGFALLKTTSALGWCPAYKLWGCATSGG